ncbi:uncharacterized protein [Primulina huaijiensis]|uniref:uncharacterized protein n=1 Tax=Primulina huaijiensis TaxID=1492673 RepID=UPI003CC6EC9B
MSSKSIIADLNKGDKLNGDNYDTLRHKIGYVLDEQDVLEGINQVMQDPGVGNTAQQRRDQEAYQAWKKKDSTAHALLVSSVIDDLIHECEQHLTAHDIWVYLREKYGGTTVTRLRQLTTKFDTYKKLVDHSIKQHLRTMSNMIRELTSAGHILSDEQQV